MVAINIYLLSDFVVSLFQVSVVNQNASTIQQLQLQIQQLSVELAGLKGAAAANRLNPGAAPRYTEK